MKNTSVNKWLVISIILFICFIIIPIVLNFFNIKEGALNLSDVNQTVKRVGDSVGTANTGINVIKSNIQTVKDAGDKITTAGGVITRASDDIFSTSGRINAASSNINDSSGRINAASSDITKASGSINAASGKIDAVKDDTGKILGSRAEITKAITDKDTDNKNLLKGSDNVNLTIIYDAINSLTELFKKIPTNTITPTDYTAPFNTNSAALTAMSGQIGTYNTKLDGLNADLSTNMQGMSSNIVAYNTANLENSKAVFQINQDVTAANHSYLETIRPINGNIAAINEKMQTFDFDKLNTTMQEYNTQNAKLTSAILSKLKDYEKGFEDYKIVLNRRLLINPTTENQ